MKQPLLPIFIIWLAALTVPRVGYSQAVNEFEMKAVFIYNFTQFIQWPEKSFDESQKEFVIGVLGENVFGRYLEEAVAGETYQSRPIVIKYYSSASEIGNCHILYVGSSMGAPKLNTERPVLTIGEGSEFMKQNGLLRFYTEQNKVRFEINQSASVEAGLVISSKLLRLATLYKAK
jgi:YfiR/HmsC-like